VLSSPGNDGFGLRFTIRVELLRVLEYIRKSYGNATLDTDRAQLKAAASKPGTPTICSKPRGDIGTDIEA